MPLPSDVKASTTQVRSCWPAHQKPQLQCPDCSIITFTPEVVTNKPWENSEACLTKLRKFYPTSLRLCGQIQCSVPPQRKIVSSAPYYQKGGPLPYWTLRIGDNSVTYDSDWSLWQRKAACSQNHPLRFLPCILPDMTTRYCTHLQKSSCQLPVMLLLKLNTCPWRAYDSGLIFLHGCGPVWNIMTNTVGGT